MSLTRYWLVSVLVVSLLLAGCTGDEPQTQNGPQTDGGPVDGMLLSSEQVPSGYAVNETRWSSETGVTNGTVVRYFQDETTGGYIDLVLFHFETPEEAQASHRSALELSPGVKVAEDAAIKMTGDMEPEAAEAVVRFRSRNTTAQLTLDAPGMDKDGLYDLVAEQASNMNISYDEQELRSMIEGIVPHGPDNPIEIGDLSYLVTNKTYQGAIGNTTEPLVADGTYLVVTVEVTNTGTGPVTMNDTRFQVDSGQQIVEPDADAMERYSELGLGQVINDTVRDTAVAAGETVTRHVIFDIPDEMMTGDFQICPDETDEGCEGTDLNIYEGRRSR